MTTSQLKKIVFCILVSLGVGFAASFLTMDAVNGWYQLLEKPAFNPPNWVFGPVWTILYIMMGTAAGMVWSTPSTELRNRALLVFSLQLILNASWSLFFFSMHSPLYGLFVIFPLLILNIWCTVLFYKIHRLSGQLMVPYVLWLVYATVLNVSIYVLNQ